MAGSARGGHRRDRGRRRRRRAAAAARARPARGVPRRARARRGPGPRLADRRRRRFELLVPARARDERYVLRRPPRPPLPPSAHDMVREARLQLALAPHGIRLPPILAVCDDETVIGVPFYVMRYLDGVVVLDALPPGLEPPPARRAARPGARRRARGDPRGRRHRPRPCCVRSSRELPRAPGAAVLAALGDQRDARDSRRRRGRSRACAPAARSASRHGRPRRLPPRESHRRARASPTASRRFSTGRWGRSATRAPISGTSSRRTPSPAAGAARSASPR